MLERYGFGVQSHIWLSAVHILGTENTADYESRNFNENVEWYLNKSVFEELVLLFGLPEIDMFASRLNKQVTRFVSWKPDPEAECVNAFSVNWSSYTLIYAFPPFSFIGQTEGRQSRVDFSDTFVGNTELVSGCSGSTDRHSNCDKSQTRYLIYHSDRQSSSTHQQTTVDGMSFVRRSFESRGISEKSTGITMASWRKSTTKQYSSYINKWVAFCHQREVSPFQVSVDYVIEFLTTLYESGCRYDTLNTAHSALSSMCVTFDNFSAGSHPLVIRYMTGIHNLCPPKCKYSETWDVSMVLSYLQQLSPTETLSLKQLSYKLAMLIALTQASRSHSLSLITLSDLRKYSDSYVLKYCDLLKQSRRGRVNPVLKLKKYTPDRRH